MKQFSLIGVLVGAVVDIVSTSVLSLPLVIYVLVSSGITHLPKSQQSIALATALHGNLVLYAISIAIGCIGSIFGGYIAAWIAKRGALLNGGFSSFLCVSFGIYAIAMGKTNEPLWLAILLLPLSPALGILGGHLRSLKRNRS